MSEDALLVFVPMAVTVSADVVADMQHLMNVLDLSQDDLIARIFLTGMAGLGMEAGVTK